MDRRTFLLAVSAGALTSLGGVAGCAGPDAPAPGAPTRTALPTPAAPTPVLQDGPPALTRMTPPSTVVSWVPDTPPLVAITVDDGVSSPVVKAYVQLAKATGIRLTFFANGVNASWRENSALMRPLVEAGQIQLANHTWDHPDIRGLSYGDLVDELASNEKYLKNLFGVSTKPYFRPPFMAHDEDTDQICIDEGYSVITWWTGSFGDSTEITAPQVLANATEYLRAGNIVIGHANFPAVTKVFDQIIGLLQTRRLLTVTLDDVFTTSPD